MTLDDEFIELKDAYPRWRFWRGVNGLKYAARRRTSPAVVKRSESVEGLRAEVEAETRYRAEHWG